MQPWEVWRFVSGRTFEVRAGVLWAFENTAEQLGIRLEWPEGPMGPAAALNLTVALATLRDELDGRLEDFSAVGLVRDESSNGQGDIPLGEWYWQGVSASGTGLSIEGVQVLSWDHGVCTTAEGQVSTPPVLVAFSVVARVVMRGAGELWHDELTGLSQVAALGATAGTRLVERVAR